MTDFTTNCTIIFRNDKVLSPLSEEINPINSYDLEIPYTVHKTPELFKLGDCPTSTWKHTAMSN